MASLSRKIKRTQMRRNRREKSTYSLERSLRRLQSLGVGLGSAMVLLGLPTAGVAGGGFTQVVDGNTTTYTQTADKVFNQVGSYNIGIDQMHQYVQPSADAIFLQRVTGQDPSSILGSLVANGQVWVMNPSGVLIGTDARINTAGFLGTSLVMDEDDFFAGRYDLKQEGDGGYVINKGEIVVNNGGYAILAGGSVVNEGLVAAEAGEVVLAAGKAMSFDFDGDGLINFAVDEKTAAKITGPNGADLTSAVLNAGQISAGKVTMTASAARTVFDAVVNNEGIVEATSVVAEGGVIRLLGGDEGDVVNTGTLDASGATAGGEVVLNGEYIGNAGVIKADAENGDGGNVEVVSDVGTILFTGSTISASADLAGDGGTIEINSAGDTFFAAGASISANAGATAGDGGFLEVSAAEGIVVDGDIDLSSSAGKNGTFLLDPSWITIIDSAAPAGLVRFSLRIPM